jgi:hypothetical protein
MAHAERTGFPAPADIPIASLDVDIRRNLAVPPRRASLRLRTSGIQSAGIGDGRERAQCAAGSLWTWPSNRRERSDPNR